MRPQLKVTEVKKVINKLGRCKKRLDEQFSFVGFAGRRGQHLLVEIKNSKNKKKVTRRYCDIQRGRNPFNSNYDFHEVNVVQPKIKKFLKSLNFIVEEEVCLSKRSRIDFVCTNKQGKKILIEVKSDKKEHFQVSLTSQLTKYKVDGKRKYKNKYAGVFLVSENGSYGYSIKELKKYFKQKRLI